MKMLKHVIKKACYVGTAKVREIWLLLLLERAHQVLQFTHKDRTIEPNSHISTYESGLWARWCEEAKDDPYIQKKKYSFQTRV